MAKGQAKELSRQEGDIITEAGEKNCVLKILKCSQCSLLEILRCSQFLFSALFQDEQHVSLVQAVHVDQGICLHPHFISSST